MKLTRCWIASRHLLLLGAAATVACASPSKEQTTASGTQAATAPPLGTVESFAVLAAETVTNTGPSVITGDLGVAPGNAITGFPPGLVGGTTHAGDAVALQAQVDASSAFDALGVQACDVSLTGQDLGGLTLTAGTYCLASSAQLTGALTLDAQGDPEAVFVFQIASTLTTASGATVAVINGGNPCNVFWQVGSSATIGTGTTFLGTILARASVTLQTTASLIGRAVALDASVTLDDNTISSEACQLGGGTTASVGGGTTTSVGSGGVGGVGTATSDASVGVGGAGGDADGGGGQGSVGVGQGGFEASSGQGGSEESSVGIGGHGAGTTGGGGQGEGAGGQGGFDEEGGGTTCDGVCVDLQTDAEHCGACGNACEPGESCVDGLCCSSP